ncbi:MAG: imidazole glycerol phosphate synthase subunit HisH [candidate division WOR-3 bacterium]|jgi:glutamine amidotransferase
MIAIIDYGAGNLRSVKKAFNHLEVKNIIATSAEDLSDVNGIVLPGVGAFGSAMEKLKETNFYEGIKSWISAGKPFLGICLGMQMLFEESTESENVRGFGVLKGKCERFKKGKVPQIGWNRINIVKESPLLKGIPDETFFYFLHGYYVEAKNPDIITAKTDYFVEYTSIIANGNVFGVQFHPEKSGKMGLKMLKNWVELC